MSEQQNSFKNKNFISSRDAAHAYRVTNDYIARLARKGKLKGRLNGRLWYVEEASLARFFAAREKVNFNQSDPLVGSVSSREAAKIYRVTNDYIARLARQGKLVGELKDGVWMVRKESLKDFFAHREPNFFAQEKSFLSDAAVHFQKQPSVIFAPKKSFFAQKSFIAFASALALLFVFAFATPAGALLRAPVSELAAAAALHVDSPFFFPFSKVVSTLSALFAPQKSDQSPIVQTTVPATSTQTIVNNYTTTNTTNHNTYNTTNTYPAPVVTGVSQADFDSRINSLRGEIFSSINSVTPTYAGGGPTNNIALSQRIDKLSGVDISNSTVHSLSGLTDSDIPDTITVSNYVPLTGGTITGDLTITGTCTGCGTGGGSSDTNWSFFNNTGIRLATTTNQVLIGASSTSTLAKLEVVGGANFDQATTTSFFTTTSSSTNSFSTYATSSAFFATTASSTQLYGAGLNTCNAGNVLTWSGGTFGCAVDQTAAGAADPFIWANNYGVVAAATSSPLWAQSGVFASSTSRFEFASTSVLTATLASTTNLRVGSLSGLLYGTNGSVGTIATNTLGLLASSSISATAPLAYNVATGIFSIQQANTSQDGYLSSSDFASFNARLSTTTLGLFDKGYFFSTTSAIYFADASTTIAKTYAANIFTTTQILNAGLLSVGSTTINGNATTTGTLFASIASSTSLFTTNATSSAFAITNVGATLLKTLSSGAVVAAVAGTDYVTPGTDSVGAWFTPGASSFGTAANSTSTLILFTAGISASSTSRFAGISTISATTTVFSSISSSTIGGFLNAVNGGYVSLTGATTSALAVTGSTTISSVLNVAGQLNANSVLGVASTTPWARFSVDTSNLTTGQPSFAVGSSSRTDFVITQAGNVGVGTTSPYAPLSVSTSGFLASVLSSSNTAATYLSMINTSSGGHDWWLGTTGSSNGWGVGKFAIYDNTAAANRFLIDTAGNTGISSTTPWARFSVDTSSLAAGVPSFAVGSSSRTDFVVTQSGNVGVGTTSPRTTFHTVSSDTSVGGNLLENTSMVFSNGFSVLQLQRDTNTLNTGVGTGFSLYDSASTTQEYGYIGALIESATASAEKGSLIFDTTSSGSARQERMRITAAGNVGIGSTSPWGLLSVNASGLAAGVPQFVVGSSTRTNFVVTQAGRVVIGTSTALNPDRYGFLANDLQINGTSTNSTGAGLTFVTKGSGGADDFRYANLAYHNQILSVKPGSDTVSAGSTAGFDGPFQIDMANSRVATTYDLNIGAINSTYPFYVEKGASAWAGLILNTFSNATVYFAHGSGYGMHINPSSNASASTYGLQVLDNTAATALYVRGDGKVGIGTSGPLFQFMAQDSVAGSYVGEFYNADTSATSRGIRIRAGSSAGNPGTTNYFILFANGGGTTKGYISGDGAGGVNYTSSSDRRLKENIATTTAGLDTLMKVSVRDFDFISDPEHRKLQGFIAQELNDVYPQAVSSNGDNGTDPLASTSMPWSVDYGRVTPLIVQAVQDLNLKLEDLATTTASSSLPQGSFTTHFFSSLFVRMSMWLADAGNGIADIFATNLHADVVYAKTVHTDELCVGSVCVTEAQFMSAFTSHSNSTQGSGTPAPQDEASSTPPAPEATSTPPVPQEEATSTPPTEELSAPTDESASTTPSVVEPTASSTPPAEN